MSNEDGAHAPETAELDYDALTEGSDESEDDGQTDDYVVLFLDDLNDINTCKTVQLAVNRKYARDWDRTAGFREIYQNW